jgi:hypothetical protein
MPRLAAEFPDAAPGCFGELPLQLCCCCAHTVGETASAMPTTDLPAGVSSIFSGVSACVMRSGSLVVAFAAPHGRRTAKSGVLARHCNYPPNAARALWRTYATAQG